MSIVAIAVVGVSFSLLMHKFGSPPSSSSGPSPAPTPADWNEVQQTLRGRIKESSSSTQLSSLDCMKDCRNKNSMFANYHTTDQKCYCYNQSTNPLAFCNYSGAADWNTWSPGQLPPSTCPAQGIDLSDCHEGGMMGLPSDQAGPFDPSGDKPTDSAGCAFSCFENPAATAASWVSNDIAQTNTCKCYQVWAGEQECWDVKKQLQDGDKLDFWTKTGQSNCSGGKVPRCSTKPDPGTCSPNSCSCSMGTGPAWQCTAKAPDGCNSGFKPYCRGHDGDCGFGSWGNSCGCDCVPE